MLSSTKWAGLLGGALLAWPWGAWAQSQVTVNDQPYEAANWSNNPTTSDAVVSTNSADWTGGTVHASGTVFARVQSGPTASFTGTNAAWNVGPVHAFGPDLGSITDPATAVDGDVTMTVALTATNLPPPTELLFYAGAAPYGMKATVWQWAATDAGTTFELVDHTNFSTAAGSGPARLEGNGTNALVWRSYGPTTANGGVFVNNGALAVVRIRNPNGITGFSITTNRLHIDTGAFFNSPGQIQATDFTDMAILLRPRPKAGDDTATTPAGTPVTVAVQGNDTVPAVLAVSGIDLDPATPGVQATRTVTGQGDYAAVNEGGVWQVRFTPVAGFVGASSVPYALVTANGDQSNAATLNVNVAAAPGGGGTTTTAVPTLSELALAALALMLGALGWRQQQRRAGARRGG